MSEMFTKIGGFIASGEPLVYADSATMTGIGTVADPFGVKATELFVQSPLYTGTSGTSAYIGYSGYNETVLFSGEITGSAECTLSETLNNYDRFRIKYRCWSDDYTVHEMTQPADHSLVLFQSIDGFGNGDALFMNVFSGSDDKTKLRFLHNYYWNPVAGGNKAEGISNARIYSVVGINRKQ